MKKYIFETTATMKEYNNKKWWIDSGIVPRFTIAAANVREALELYREKVAEKCYISISDNAIKCKSAMYIDTPAGDVQQVGYVYRYTSRRRSASRLCYHRENRF